ncbi:hypothetical protein H6A58_16015 [Phocaeicola coprocola]|nr:hypothetical protein [Phocaeicola coprocola]
MLVNTPILEAYDLGDTYSQSVAYGNEKETDSFMEFLRSCNNDEDYTYVGIFSKCP